MQDVLWRDAANTTQELNMTESQGRCACCLETWMALSFPLSGVGAVWLLPLCACALQAVLGGWNWASGVYVSAAPWCRCRN